MSPRQLLLALALALAAVAATLALLPGTSRPPLVARTGPAPSTAKVWGYQLQGARAELIAPEIDLLVIDHARESGGTDLLSPADIAAFRDRGPGAPPRIVLCYLSVGEAEKYRYYWNSAWTSKAYLGLLHPHWLARENRNWKGNYLVHYWEPGWQKIIFEPRPALYATLAQKWLGSPAPYLDQVLEAGFDGVYLDRVDAFGDWEKKRPGAELEMAAFVQKLSAYAKARKPGFLVVPQNGEELLARDDFRSAVDAVAKEDLFYGADKPESANDREESARSIEFLRKLQIENKPVFVVEYLRDQNARAIARARLTELGFIATFAVRELNQPPEVLAPAAPPREIVPPAGNILRPATPKPHP